MPYVAGRYMDPDEYADLRAEAAEDEYGERAVRCAGCGTEYDPGLHPATRWEPAWVEQEECPECGCGEIV